MTKQRTKKRGSIFLTVAFLAMVCYFFVSLFGLRGQISQKKAEIAQLEHQIEQREAENADLEQLLKQGDVNAFVEKRARDEDLGYIYPGERVYYDLNAGH